MLILLFVAVQLSIPISRLGAHDTTPRFGWQMFSSGRASPDFRVVTIDGVLEIESADYMASPRSDIDVTSLMPKHLCAVVSQAIRVTWSEGGNLQC